MSSLKQLLPYIPESLRDYYLNKKYNNQLVRWKKNGCPLPTPHIIKQQAIFFYKKKYQVDTLIETGTYLGDMVYAQRNNFTKIYTIELSSILFKRSQKRLRKYKNIEVIHGDSGVLLSSIVQKTTNKAIFWLDGHYSGGITAIGNYESPIVLEVKSILESKIEHIILIDDARNFNGTNDYPTITELKEIIMKSRFINSSLIIENDIIKISLKF